MHSIDMSRCILCGECVEECHRKALSINGDYLAHDADKCMWCGHCMAVCPRDSIIIDGDGYNCEDVEDIGFAPVPTRIQIRNLILSRRSVRRFTEDPVTEEELSFILEAGKYAPTGMNLQGNAFIAVKEGKVKELCDDTTAAFGRLIEKGSIPEERIGIFERLCREHAESGTDNIYYGAPLVLFVFAERDTDGAIAAAHMGMMAQSQQLGYCFEKLPAAAYDDEIFAKKWGRPEGKNCVIAMAIGNPEPEYFCSVPRKEPFVLIF